MAPPSSPVEFLFLCSIQIVTIVFSLLVMIDGVKRYRSTNKSEVILRKSVKYFIFILITIAVAGLWGLFVNFYFLITDNGLVAGYLYLGIIVCILVNIFCAWQFLNYLLHPERRKTKYPIGIVCVIGIALLWFFPAVMVDVSISPILESHISYIYVFVYFVFVYTFFAFEFFKHSYSASEKAEKYRFFCLGLSAFLSMFLFLGYFWGLVFAWIFILSSTVLLYLGYKFPESFQRAIKLIK